jgi:LEA14-like dessication related protein
MESKREAKMVINHKIRIFSLALILLIFSSQLILAQTPDLETAGFDFGEVAEGELLKHTFILENNSSNTLQIKSINTSCDCTKVEIEKQQIPPKENTEIKVQFDTQGYSGRIAQFVYIITDQEDRSTIKLTLEADIKKDTQETQTPIAQRKRLKL